MFQTMTNDELRAWLRLSIEPGMGPAQARALLAAIGLPQDILASPAATLGRYIPAALAHQLRQPPAPETQTLIEKTLKWLELPDRHVVTLADANYPRLLLDTADPPLLLYAHGNIQLLNRPAMAVVGARSATAGGVENAHAFAHFLADRGWTIVSGLALGIDAAAHEGALAAGPNGGSTVAVLGTGIDVVYPARHRALAHRLAAAGLLVSELPLGTRALRYHFPKRNRLVAGLSRGVLVVEAAAQSGSLITARLAGELGREVFAIPGSIHSPLSRGCHALIRQGAKLVESGEDIHDELQQPGLEPATAARAPGAHPAVADAPASSTNDDTRRVLAALGWDPVHPDTLLRRSGLDTTRLSAVLLRLELDGRLARLGDGCYQRL